MFRFVADPLPPFPFPVATLRECAANTHPIDDYARCSCLWSVCSFETPKRPPPNPIPVRWNQNKTGYGCGGGEPSQSTRNERSEQETANRARTRHRNVTTKGRALRAWCGKVYVLIYEFFFLCMLKKYFFVLFFKPAPFSSISLSHIRYCFFFYHGSHNSTAITAAISVTDKGKKGSDQRPAVLPCATKPRW